MSTKTVDSLAHKSAFLEPPLGFVSEAGMEAANLLLLGLCTDLADPDECR
jgi:hypothetical protein